MVVQNKNIELSSVHYLRKEHVVKICCCFKQVLVSDQPCISIKTLNRTKPLINKRLQSLTTVIEQILPHLIQIYK